MSKYFTYILLCDQKTYYVGVTSNLNRRLLEHKNKQSFYTKQFSDIELIYSETYTSLVIAQRREKQLKGWSHAKKSNYIDRKLKESTGLVEVLARMRSLPWACRRESLSPSLDSNHVTMVSGKARVFRTSWNVRKKSHNNHMWNLLKPILIYLLLVCLNKTCTAFNPYTNLNNSTKTNISSERDIAINQ